MQCPVDSNTLQMTTRDGIEIDYCPTCRGVWLDRGELDKLIERASSYYGTAAQQPQARPLHPQQPSRHADDDDDDYRHRNPQHDNRHYDDDYGHHKKKKEGFLGDLFDF